MIFYNIFTTNGSQKKEKKDLGRYQGVYFYNTINFIFCHEFNSNDFKLTNVLKNNYHKL